MTLSSIYISIEQKRLPQIMSAKSEDYTKYISFYYYWVWMSVYCILSPDNASIKRISVNINCQNIYFFIDYHLWAVIIFISDALDKNDQ